MARSVLSQYPKLVFAPILTQNNMQDTKGKAQSDRNSRNHPVVDKTEFIEHSFILDRLFNYDETFNDASIKKIKKKCTLSIIPTKIWKNEKKNYLCSQ